MDDVIIIEKKALEILIEKVVERTFERILKKLNLDDRHKKTILKIEEAAKFTGYAINTIYEKTSNKQIPHFKFEGSLRFFKEDLEQWMIGKGKIKTVEEIETEAVTHTLNSPPKI